MRQKGTLTCGPECSGQGRDYHSSPARPALSLMSLMMKMKETNSIISKAFPLNFLLTTGTRTQPGPCTHCSLHPCDADLPAPNPSLKPACPYPSLGPALMQKLCNSQKSRRFCDEKRVDCRGTGAQPLCSPLNPEHHPQI